MKRCVVLILLLMVLGGSVSTWAQMESETPVTSDAWSPKQEDRDRFKLITQVNIFLQERPRVVEERPREQRVEPGVDTSLPLPSDPDRQNVLVGVSVLEGAESPEASERQRVVVFVENRRSGEVTRLTEPGPFSLGEVTDLHLDGLTYVVGDERRQITVGQSLTGEVPSSVSGAVPASGDTSSVHPSSSDTPNPEESEILRRLRERRNRE